jgi:hypothetical protein
MQSCITGSNISFKIAAIRRFLGAKKKVHAEPAFALLFVVIEDDHSPDSIKRQRKALQKLSAVLGILRAKKKVHAELAESRNALTLLFFCSAFNSRNDHLRWSLKRI